MRKSWKKSEPSFRSFTDAAASVMRLLVSARRADGEKAPDAIRSVAQGIGVSETRVNCLLFRPEEPIVLADEWNYVRVRAANMLRREAGRLRARAERYEAKAAALEYEQVSLWKDTTCGGAAGSDYRQRRAA